MHNGGKQHVIQTNREGQGSLQDEPCQIDRRIVLGDSGWTVIIGGKNLNYGASSNDTLHATAGPR
jgi:hypothetical protein